MGGMLTCLATNLVCCCSSAACHCFNTKFKPNSSSATRIAYAFLFLIISIFAWSLQTGWIDRLLMKIPGGSMNPYNPYDCPDRNCFSGNFAVARVLFALSLFHLIFGALMIGVKSSKEFRAGIQNGWWGPKFLLIVVFIVIAFFIPDPFFQTYSTISFVGAIFFILVQLVLLIDFAANWSESWVGKWEDSGSKHWLVLLLATGIVLALLSLSITIISYYFFCKSSCKLNIFFVTFNLILSLIAYGMSVHPKIQEYRPSSGILQSGTVVLYACYLLVSALSGETYPPEQAQCNPFAEGGQKLATVLGTLFTFVAIAYSTSRTATNSKILMSSEKVPDTESAVDHNESLLPLISNEAPAPMSMTVDRDNTGKSLEMTSTATKQTQNDSQSSNNANEQSDSLPQNSDSNANSNSNPSSNSNTTPASTNGNEQELIDIGVVSDKDSRKRHLREAVDSGALPMSALDDEDEDEEEQDPKALSNDDEKNGCNYNYAFYHVIFCCASMYVLMLVNNWSTKDNVVNIVNQSNNGFIPDFIPGSNSEELLDSPNLFVGHDWSTVWVKIVSSWLAILIYMWTLIAPILLPNRNWN